jgi:hypothetical protein
LRYAVHATRKPGVTVRGHPLGACASPLDGTLRVIGLRSPCSAQALGDRPWSPAQRMRWALRSTKRAPARLSDISFVAGRERRDFRGLHSIDQRKSDELLCQKLVRSAPQCGTLGKARGWLEALNDDIRIVCDTLLVVTPDAMSAD